MRSILTGMALAAAISTAANAAGEHERRLGAEVTVMSGDARQLTASTPEARRMGLVLRIKGSLAGLPLLVRQAREANPALAALPPQAADGVREALDRQNWPDAVAALAGLARLYPFDPSGILPAESTPARLRLGKAIHEQTCAGCHDHPDADVMLPAQNLFRSARAMPSIEFAARLYAGIRGDALTALANPLGAAEMAALIAYYRQGPKN